MDANNLYGLAMCKTLPYDNSKWHYNKIDEKKILNYTNDDEIGYIVEVYLEYISKRNSRLTQGLPISTWNYEYVWEYAFSSSKGYL